MSRFVDRMHVKDSQADSTPAGGGALQAMGKTKRGRNSKPMAMTDLSARTIALILVGGQAYGGSSESPI
jgi:hypothetical protein